MSLSDRRVQNLYWSISENYDRKYQGDPAFYVIGERAFLDLVFPKNQLENFIKRNTQFLSNQEDLRKVIEIAAKDWIRDSFLRVRPGMAVHEGGHYEGLFQDLDRMRKRSFSQEMDYQYSRHRTGRPLTPGPILSPLLEDIFSLKTCKDSKDFFQGIIGILKKFFHVNAEFVSEDIVVELKDLGQDEEVKKKKKRRIVEEKIREEDFESEEIESAEFTNVKRDRPEEGALEEPGIQVASKGEEKTFKRIVMHFGNQDLLQGRQAELERIISRGIHKGMKLHLTRGNFEKDMNSRFFEDQILLQRQANLEAFEKDQHHYRRAIFELREILRKNLFDDFDQSQWRTSRGEVDPQEVWKYYAYGEKNIFNKKYFDRDGSFSVDILLDMSASQQERQEEVAIQGFLITEALVELGIPTRVMGFCNLFNYQILRLFRDYKDDKRQNMEIFSYKASGSNRDGYALRYVFETMKEIQAENQVLIVLSDGRPNDQIHIIGGSNQEVANYEDEEAVYDTAGEVLQGRIRNKAILGVFTGQDQDLDQEKLIFGHDFVRITDLSRFSTVVGKYLKSVIERI